MDLGFRTINDLPCAHWDETEFSANLVKRAKKNQYKYQKCIKYKMNYDIFLHILVCDFHGLR